VHGFALIAANAFANTLAPALKGEKFKFVFCSGMGAEWDQTKPLWFLKDTRRIKVSEIHLPSSVVFAADSSAGLRREALGCPFG
jgi:hypothetical protein